MVVEAIQAIGDADLGAKDEGCALVEYGVGEVERYHRVLQWMLDEHTYLARQLSVFYRHATKRYLRGSEFVGRVLLRLETRRCKEHKI
jgi:hypothetical protein